MAQRRSGHQEGASGRVEPEAKPTSEGSPRLPGPRDTSAPQAEQDLSVDIDWSAQSADEADPRADDDEYEPL